MSYNRPVQVFTDLKNIQKVPRDFTVAERDMAAGLKVQEALHLSSLDRQICVTGSGELTLPPDRFAVTIKCKSSKDNIQDAKNSVTRRVDYIVQTLKNHSLKDDDFRTYQHISHIDSLATVDCEMEAHFTDLYKCQSVSNLLAEKLGPGVSVSLPHCYHARGSLDKLRKQVGMLAIHNARQKALEMAHVLHLSVGAALQVQELGTDETHGAARADDEEPDLNPSIQQRIANATVTVSNQVSVQFQLKPSKSKKT